MAPTLQNPHSSGAHILYLARVKMLQSEAVYFIAFDLAGGEGQTALGTKDEFVDGLDHTKQLLSFEKIYKIRSLEAARIDDGLKKLQSMFGELIKKKISKSQEVGLRRVFSSFISLSSAHTISFTSSASANSNKVTKATLFTHLVTVQTKKAKKKADKDKIIKQ